MRILAIIGIILIVFGLIALSVQGVTYFTQERVVDAGPVKVDVEKPHTIFFNPVAGVVAAAIGVALLIAGTRRSAT